MVVESLRREHDIKQHTVGPTVIRVRANLVENGFDCVVIVEETLCSGSGVDELLFSSAGRAWSQAMTVAWRGPWVYPHSATASCGPANDGEGSELYIGPTNGR